MSIVSNIKHARDASSSLSPVPDDLPPPKVKKQKRAETRPCPACSEYIPIRLLATHAQLEMQRVEDIIRHIGDAEVLAEVDDLDEGPSTSKRRSALKARQSLSALQPPPPRRLPVVADADTTPAAVARAIASMARRRKARCARLRELAKEEAAWRVHPANDAAAAEVVCPVCARAVRGDRDVVEAHVDACLAFESRRARVERERDGMALRVRATEDADVDVEGGPDTVEEEGVRRVITSASLQGTGIHVRPSAMDIEDDIDVDGTDDAMFGDAQFAETDVQRVTSEEADGIQNDNQRSNHDRQTGVSIPTEMSSLSRQETSDEDMDQLDLVILTARSRGDNLALIVALEAKLNAMPTPATCRICLSPYVDPTVSTGCWHTCCATCWLKCLGATKLCPMCQRITGASELRRVYL